MNKLVAGVDSKGNVIEINDAYPFLDYPMTEIEHESFMGTIDDPSEMLKKHYARYGYTVKDGMETMLLGNMCRAYTNTVLSMAPYTNEFTIDVLPTKGFDPRITDYLSNIPIPHSNPPFREMLNHRRRTLPVNGVKIHFNGSLLYRDMKAIKAGLVTKSTKAELEHLEDEQERLEVEITKEQIARPIISREHIEEWIMAFAKSDLKNQEQKQRLIDIFINSVHVYDDKIVVLFNYKDGERAIMLEDVEKAMKKENTPEECSTLFKSGDPYGN